MKEGAALEEEWEKSLADYDKKYPEEAAEFKQLISGELPASWDQALPVSLIFTRKSSFSLVFGADLFEYE